MDLTKEQSDTYVKALLTIDALEQKAQAINKIESDKLKANSIYYQDLTQKEIILMRERGFNFKLTCPVCGAVHFSNSENDHFCECQNPQPHLKYYVCQNFHGFYDQMTIQAVGKICKRCAWVRNTQTKAEHEAAKKERNDNELNANKFTHAELERLNAAKEEHEVNKIAKALEKVINK